MKYKSVVVTRRGGPEVIQIVEKDLRSPSEGEARVRVLATPLCQDDVAVRVGNRPFLAKPPFVPGYTFIGVVDAIGEKVTGVTVGDRVAALTNFGSHAEVIYWNAKELVHVPESLDPAEAVTLILNYLVAHQILHRVVQVKAGDKALIVGASGGCGTAFLQLGKLAGIKMYGLASPSKHHILAEYGAVPIDYHTQDFVEVIQQAEPNGLDFVFNGMGEEYIERGLAVLRRGGVLAHYGAPQSFARLLWLVVKLIFHNIWPNGKAIKGYGTHREDISAFKEDWSHLFKLLQEGKIKPVIDRKFPLLEAVKANELLESGQVTGNVVLLATELL
jgi:NADPH:quinone reductase-like Zn-dependent oxidoreductase